MKTEEDNEKLKINKKIEFKYNKEQSKMKEN